VEHIAMQVANACQQLAALPDARLSRLLVTGGGAHHVFLGSRIRERLDRLGIETIIPNDQLIDYKEALIMALIAVLRWREEVNVLASVTGAKRNSIGGAVWMGQEA
jgi:anhydro-N-acetylmuramic acid kinase